MVTSGTTKEDLLPTLGAIFNVTGESMGRILPLGAKEVGGGANVFMREEPIFGYAYTFGAGGTITSEDWTKIGYVNEAEVAGEIVVNEDSSLIDPITGDPVFESLSVDVKANLDLEFGGVTDYYDWEDTVVNGWEDWGDEHFLYKINDGFLKGFVDVKGGVEITQEVTQTMIDLGWVDAGGNPLDSNDLGEPAVISANYNMDNGVTLAFAVDGSVDTQGIIYSGKYVLTLALKAKGDLVVNVVFATAAEAESAEEQILTSEEVVLLVEAYNNSNDLIGSWTYTSTEFFESGGATALVTPIMNLF
jgi:hypothetical protein